MSVRLSAAPADSASKNSETNRQLVVCFGDSITRRGYPECLTNLLDVRVVNAGVNGNTTRQALARLKRDVLSLHPDVVVMFFGANDSRLDAPKTQVALEEYRSNLSKIVDQCQQIRAKVLLCNMPPITPEPYFGRHPKTNYDSVGGFEKHIAQYRETARQVALEKRAEFFDLNKALLKHPEWVSSDGVHPTPEGNQIIAKLIADELNQRFKL